MIGSDFKGKVSALLLIAGVSLAFFRTWTATVTFGLVAAMWIIPDRRIERRLAQRS